MKIHHLGLPLPRVLVDDFGEILLFGRRGKAYLDLGFLQDGTISFYGSNREGKEIMGDGLLPEDELPDEVCHVLVDIAS